MKHLCALALAGAALIFPATAGAATVGTTTEYSPVTSNSKGYGQAYRFTPASSGPMDRLSVYLDKSSTASAVEVALYDGSASRAGTRRGRCVITSPTSGAWNSCAISAYSITAGAYYWLALLQPVNSTGQLAYREGRVSGGPATYLEKQTSLSSLPLTWKNGASWSGGYQASIYADQAAPAAAAPTPTPTPTPTATPTPTPTSTPTPTPTSTSGSTACPLPAYPSASCTGVPAGTSLSAYTGPSTITTANTVVSGKTMGCVRVAAPGVVIRNSRISCARPMTPVVSSIDGDFSGTPLLVEDSEVDCQNGPGTAFGDANVTVRRTNIHGCENGFDVNQNVTVEDSYIHDLYQSSEAHPDGIQLAAGHFVDGRLVPGSLNVTIRHDTIYGMAFDGEFANAAIISNGGGDTNILIEANLFAGGGYTIYCEQGTTGVNYRVLDNHFSRGFSTKVGFYGPSTDCSDETQSGNVYHETGEPLRLP